MRYKLVRRHWLSALILLPLAVAPAIVQAVEVEFTAQLRARLEIDAKDFNSDTATQIFTLQRTRLGARLSEGKVSGFIQLQDARTWGTEANTLTDASADQFDIHQGYFDVSLRESFRLRAGRTEMNRGNQRLVGSVGWSNTGRSFDGVELNYKQDEQYVDVWVASTRDSSTMLTPGERDIDSYFMGAYGGRRWSEDDNRSELYVMFEFDRDTVVAGPDVGDSRLGRWTIGGTHYAQLNGFRGSVEAAYQLGTTTLNEDSVQADVGAYFIGVRAGYDFQDVTWSPSLRAGVDILSGDGDAGDDDFGAFNTLFATNHKFYGYMDYFPRLSGDLGLRDYIIRAKVKPSEKTWIALDLHRFERDQDDTAGQNLFGHEVDAGANYKYNQNFSVQCGISLFFPDEVIENDPKLGSDTAVWGYLMATANL